MERIGRDVGRELSRLGPSGRIGELVEAWPAAVGVSIARNAWPARIARDGTLHVATDSSTWAFELTQLAPAILGRLREALGEAAPSAVRFAPGPLPALGPASPAEAAGPPIPVVEPTAEERALAAKLAARVADEELRELVARAAASSLARAAASPVERTGTTAPSATLRPPAMG